MKTTTMGTPQNRLDSLERQRGRVGRYGGGREEKEEEEERFWGGRGYGVSCHISVARKPRVQRDATRRGYRERNAALKHAANAAGSRDRTRGRNGGGVGGGETTKHLTALTSSVPETVQILRGRQKQVRDWLQVYRAVLWYTFPPTRSRRWCQSRCWPAGHLFKDTRLSFHQGESWTIHESDVTQAKWIHT